MCEARNGKRVRKKRLYSMILNQIEFYFSNSSLTRDKYLQSLLKKDRFIPILEFMTFNKIKALTSNKDDIVQALSTSQFLQLSPDGSAVCRRSHFTLKGEAELCTIYVESIPRTTGVDALRRTFSAYGTIDYVSAPLHRATGRHRGFGFVEFRTPNMAHNALQAFGALGRRMPSEHYPEYLTSPDEAADGSSGVQGEAATRRPATPRASGEADHASRLGKRKLSTDSSSRDAPMKVTRFAETPESEDISQCPADGASHTTSHFEGSTTATPADTENSNFSESHADGTTSCSEPHREDASHGTSLLTEQTDDTDLSDQKRRKRRRTRRGRKPHLLETEDTELLGIQIMPLSEWSRYREQYRALQKDNMAAIKRSLREGAAPPTSADQGRPASVPPLFVASTVVRFTPVRAGATDKQLIDTLRQRPGVLYVELCAEGGLGYLRFDSAAAAASCLTSDLKDPCLLRGEEEESYWRRLWTERELTRGRRQRRPAERGRDKLLRRLKERIKNDP
ncbi:la-related protein 7-like [Pollicipes pollicipes]|uniref:la-related protein 7-like n=1 Tax=Pollicipes pollicipes TaxID=41117 RepID=UPI001884B20C|nr:la-related protein 7-like [Pollicipes pollicipes]XP_037077707.1 la-related protein 7-like [Pollicipes pollicipes]XP_037077708.1 la-related protein 7-like [Pollicipes pollicipes]